MTLGVKIVKSWNHILLLKVSLWELFHSGSEKEVPRNLFRYLIFYVQVYGEREKVTSQSHCLTLKQNLEQDLINIIINLLLTTFEITWALLLD